jgi:hypothetical protein
MLKVKVPIIFSGTQGWTLPSMDVDAVNHGLDGE